MVRQDLGSVLGSFGVNCVAGTGSLANGAAAENMIVNYYMTRMHDSLKSRVVFGMALRVGKDPATMRCGRCTIHGSSDIITTLDA